MFDTRLHKSKIASPPWVVRRARNDVEDLSAVRVEDISIFCEGNAIWSRRVF